MSLRPSGRRLAQQLMGTWAPGRLGAQFEVEFDVRLGAGAFGTVYPGLQRDTSQAVAIKTISAARPTAQEHIELSKGIKLETEAFVEMMQSRISHPHVVEIVECFKGPGAEAVELGLKLPTLAAQAPLHYFVMEKLEGMSVEEEIVKKGSRRKGLQESDAKRITQVICEGLSCLHENGIVHRDVKPSNVVYSCDESSGHPVPKIIDFSHCGLLPSGASTGLTDVVGTAGYVAPEILLSKEPYGAKVDSFSLGCTIHAMLTNMYLPRRHPNLGVMTDLPEDLSEEGRQLVEDLLSENPEDRPSMSEVLRSKWLEGVAE